MDLGYHFDLMETILVNRNYGRDAIKIAQFSNGLTDLVGNFLSFLPQVSDAPQSVNDSGGQSEVFSQTIRSVMLHADNLFNGGDAEKYLLQLVANLSAEAALIESKFKNAGTDVGNQSLAARNLAVLLGMAFHAIQDFCSHSTWIAQLPQDETKRQAESRVTQYCSRTPLSDQNRLKDTKTGWYEYLKQWDGWYTVEQSISANPFFHNSPSNKTIDALKKKNVDLTILEHLDQAIHLDAQERHYTTKEKRLCTWDEAYVCAYLTCKQLTNIVEKTAPSASAYLKVNGDSSIGTILSLDDRETLDDETHRMHYLFMWLQDMDHHDGHWKGPGSGDWATLVTSSLLGIAGLGLMITKVGAPIILLPILLKFVNPFDAPIKSEFKLLLDKNHLTKDLYNISASPPATSNEVSNTGPFGKVLSIRVQSCVMTERIPAESEFGSVTVTRRSVPIGPDLFLRATVRWHGSDKVSRSVIYNERAHQNVPGKIDEDSSTVIYELKAKGYHDAPWEVLHIAEPDVNEVSVYLQLFDEDTLATGADDEIKISKDGTNRLGVEFKFGLQDQKVTHEAATSGLDWATPSEISNTNAAAKLSISGVTKDWFFPPDTAKLEIAIVVASIG